MLGGYKKSVQTLLLEFENKTYGLYQRIFIVSIFSSVDTLNNTTYN